MQQPQQPTGGGTNSGPSGGLPEGSAAATAYAQHFAAQQALGEDLERFWDQAQGEVDEHSEVLADFKAQALPLARIKKIMKSDEDVRMISAEAPVLFARACEFFIQELTLRSWAAAQEYKRRTIQRSDVATAITRTDVFDFLIDIVPREEANEPPGTDGAAAAAQLVGVPPPPVPMPGGGAPQMGMLSPAQQQQQQQPQQQQFQGEGQQQQQQQQQPQGDGQQMALQWPPPQQAFPPGGGQQFGFPPMQPFGMPPFGAFPMHTQPGMQQFPGSGQQQQQ